MDFGNWQISNGQISNGQISNGQISNGENSNWRSSTGGQATAEAERPLCRCLDVTESDIREAISEHEPQTVQGVSQICGAGAGCMSCHRHIRRMLNDRAVCRRSDPLPR